MKTARASTIDARRRHGAILRALVVLTVCAVSRAEADDTASDFASAFAVLTKHCTGCHNPDDLDGDLDLTTHGSILRGNDDGPVVVPGKGDESKLVLVVEHKLKPFMPPGKRARPAEGEIATLRRWVAAGAPAPAPNAPATLETPRIEPLVSPRRQVNALAWSPDGRRLAAAAYGVVRVLDAPTRAPLWELAGITGNVNAVEFSTDGRWLVAGAGETGLSGELRVWSGVDLEPVALRRGHTDSIFAVAVAPAGTLVATGSYDQTIRLWDLEGDSEPLVLRGHNGAVFGLAFRADGRVLASASADRTVKLWSVESGERLDTFSQALGALHTVVFSPDGAHVAAAGADNRIRVWRVSATAEEGSNPLLVSRFAHEGALLALAFSRDGRSLASSARDGTVKLWEPAEMAERVLLESQPDWPGALAFSPKGDMLAVGRLDGSLGFYDANRGRALRVARVDARHEPARGVLVSVTPGADQDDAKPAPKPELARAEPRGVQRGATSRVRLVGSHLAAVSELFVHRGDIRGRLLDDDRADGAVWIELEPSRESTPGRCELSVKSSGGESGRVAIFVDTLPQVVEREPNDTPADATSGAGDTSFWGAIGAAGDADCFSFDAVAGATVVLDVAAARLGSKANLELAVLDASGRVVDRASDVDGDADPLLAFRAPASGRYTARVRERALGASAEHFYRLSIGGFAFVIGVHPLAVPAGRESEIELAGYNLPPPATARVPAGEGMLRVRLDEGVFRARRSFDVAAVAGALFDEAEPNDAPHEATRVETPCELTGRVAARPDGGLDDRDLFAFRASAGERWIIETEAARLGSPVDTLVEVFHADGSPVERVQLQAVRDSNVTFRPIDSNTIDVRLTNWEEMDLNQYVWFQGEVNRIFRMPQGPDSGFNLYRGAAGKRRCYFDTSASAHANEEPCYVVEPHPPGEALVPTGLPTFTLYYANDDDGERELGNDSRLTFTAPADGVYLLRVIDARFFGGEHFAYRARIRRPRPGYVPSIDGAGATVERGGGKSFTCRVRRVDGFDGPVRFDIANLPPGFTASTPIVIEAGHDEAFGTINVAADAPQTTDDSAGGAVVTATALVDGVEVVETVAGGLGRLRVGGEPAIRVTLGPVDGAVGTPEEPVEIAVAAGARVPARLAIVRNGHTERVTFDVRNLPHGMIVDDIGLNGVLIPPDATERQISLSCAPWVAPTTRLCFARSNEAGGQTSLPVLVRVTDPRGVSSETREPGASARTEAFDGDPGWSGVNNRSAREHEPVSIRQDFGWVGTSRAGGAPGEIGGFVTPAGEAAYYAKAIGPRSLETPLEASGSFACADGPFNVLLGFFNATSINEWRTPSSLALRLNGRGDHFYAYVEYCTARWRAGGDTTPFPTRQDPETGRRALIGFASGGSVHRWSLRYDPRGHDGRGVVRATIDGETAECILDEGHKADGAVFDRFGLLNVVKSADSGGDLFIDDVTVLGALETFDADPGWDGLRNRGTYRSRLVRPRFDFGFSPTRHAGGAAAGELGGTVFRGDCRYGERMACFGDAIGPLTLERPLHASGKLAMTRGVTDSTTLFGFFDSTASVRRNDSQKDAIPEGVIGIHIEGPSREGFCVYPVCRPLGGEGRAARADDAPHIFPDGASHDWSLDYDPEGAGGRGRIVVTLDGRTASLDLDEGVKASPTRFDRFGIVTSWIDGNSQDVYWDDITYTVRQ